MKIKIVEEIPVEEKVKPKVNEIYDVVDIKEPERGKRHDRKIYYIIVNNEVVGIFDNECVVLEDAKSKI